jgi:hypothetical protein
MDTTIIIPCVRRSRFLETQTLPAIAAHTPASVPVVVACEPDLNVSQCRQKHMDAAETRYVYFMDVDSIILQDDWLSILLDIMDEHQAGAVTATEHWNGNDMMTGKPFTARGIVVDVGRAIGAGFLYDRKAGAYWDPWLGETYGYIGRELEDVDFAQCVRAQGRKCYKTDLVTFNHAWHEKSDWESDEFALWDYVGYLIKFKWRLPAGEERDRFFRLLHPLATSAFEKNHNVENVSKDQMIRAIYGDVVEYWGGDINAFVAGRGCFSGDRPTTPEQRGVKDIWSGRYKEVKPRSPK